MCAGFDSNVRDTKGKKNRTPIGCPDKVYGNFARGEYTLTCRLRASSTRSAWRMRTQRLRRRVRFLVRITTTKKDTSFEVPYLTGISPLANICSLYAWQTSLPISERQMRTHATYVAGFDERTGQPTTEKRKSRTSVLLSVVGDPYGNRTHVFSVRG